MNVILRNSFLSFLSIFCILSLAGCAAPLSPEEAARTKAEGIEKAKKGEYQEAVILLEKALRFDIKDIEVYRFLAESYEGLGEYSKAIESWEKLLFVADPNSAQAKEAHQRLLKARERQKARTGEI